MNCRPDAVRVGPGLSRRRGLAERGLSSRMGWAGRSLSQWDGSARYVVSGWVEWGRLGSSGRSGQVQEQVGSVITGRAWIVVRERHGPSSHIGSGKAGSWLVVAGGLAPDCRGGTVGLVVGGQGWLGSSARVGQPGSRLVDVGGLGEVGRSGAAWSESARAQLVVVGCSGLSCWIVNVTAGMERAVETGRSG